jgi:hypothetical protein
LRNAKDTKYGTAIWPVSNVLETISGTWDIKINKNKNIKCKAKQNDNHF